MRFHPSPDQSQFQASIEGVVANLATPARKRSMIDAATDFDPDLWRAVFDLGFGAVAAPEAFGGLGLGAEHACFAMEALGRAGAAGPFLSHLIAVFALSETSNEQARSRWLAALASGDMIASVALGGDWSPESWDAEFAQGCVSGRAGFVQSAEKARLFLIGLKGGGLALAEAGASVDVRPIASSDLTRRLSTVSFDRTPCEIVAAPGSDLGPRIFSIGLALLAADALGGAQQCLDMSVAYAKMREQFGGVIGRFQAIKHQLANMALEIEPARALVWYSAYALDQHLPEAPRAAAHAKAHLADRFTSVSRLAVQVHGGIGYTWEYDLQLWFRRALFDHAFFGAPFLHRERAAQMAGW